MDPTGAVAGVEGGAGAGSGDSTGAGAGAGTGAGAASGTRRTGDGCVAARSGMAERGSGPRARKAASVSSAGLARVAGIESSATGCVRTATASSGVRAASAWAESDGVVATARAVFCPAHGDVRPRASHSSAGVRAVVLEVLVAVAVLAVDDRSGALESPLSALEGSECAAPAAAAAAAAEPRGLPSERAWAVRARVWRAAARRAATSTGSTWPSRRMDQSIDAASESRNPAASSISALRSVDALETRSGEDAREGR